MKNKRIVFALELSLYVTLKETSRITGVPMSEIIRRAINEYLDKMDKV